MRTGCIHRTAIAAHHDIGVAVQAAQASVRKQRARVRHGQGGGALWGIGQMDTLGEMPRVLYGPPQCP